MRKRVMALLLGLVLLAAAIIPVTAMAAEGEDGSFVFVAMNANSTIVEPTRIHYKTGQTILEALSDSDIEFVGLEQGFIYEVNGVSANYMIYYDKGGYKLDAQASSIKAICIHVSSTYSDAAIQLILQMADYLDMTNHVQNYPAAASAYAAALKGLRTANADTAATLLQNLKDAIAEYAALLDGTQYTVSAAATQNGNALTEPVITLTDAYGNVTTGTGSAKVIAGDYKFSVSDGGHNRTDGTLTVSADAKVSVTLPYGEWFSNIRLLDADKEPYRVVQNRADHTVEYWIEDTASALSSVYLNAAMGKVPDTKATKLRAIYTGTNGRDMSNLSRSWNSTATSLTYLLSSGMENRTFALEAQYTGSDGYTQIQSYAVTVTRVPTLKSLAVTAEGTKLPLNFEPTVREYSLTTVSTALDIAAAPFDEGYTVTGSGAVTLSGDSLNHTIQVTAPNGERNSYTLHIQKVASVPVTLNVPSGTTVQVFNGAGSEIAPVDGTYHLVPGESYTCIATKNTWYHTQITFTASNGLNVSVPEPVATDWLTNLAFYNGTYASSRIAYAADKTFSAAEHTYNYTVSDCNSSVAMQATADGTVTAMYQTQSTVPETHGLAQTVTVPNPVSQTGLAQNLTYAVAKSGYGQTVTIRISKEEDGTSYYQDYTVRLLRQLHLSSLSVATKDETLPFMTTSGGTARFDRDTTDYYVRVDRETTALYISGTYPNSSADTACCGGYYAKVNGVRYDTPAGAEATLNTDLYNEDILVQVCHADTGSIELTYTVHVQKSDPIQLTIQTTPAEAIIFLTNDLNGKRIVEKNGTYSLTPGASYSYTTTGKPSLLSFNPKTGELLSSYKMNVTGDIRSSITHYNGKYYFTSKGGYFFEASVDAEGNIEDVRTLKLYNYADDPANPAMSTCTPTIYNGRAYIGISGTAQFGAYSGHNLTVIDIPNWEIAYTVRTHGYPQTSGVLTTAYKEETGCVYVYFFDNFTPGKLRVLEDRPGQTEVSLKTMETYTASGKSETYTTPHNIFTPSGAQAQYAICSPIMDEYGTIYFKNDSAYLMAVGSTIERIEVTKLPDKTTYKVKDTFDPTGMQVTAYYANGKTRDITDYVTWSETPLTADDTDFQITFPYAMYQNRENSDTLEMEYGVHCDKPMTTLTLTIEDTTEVKYGDVNGDGKVASTDAAIVYRYANGKYQLSANQLLAADVNGDGVVNSTDAALIYRMANGKLLKFPVEKEKQSEQTTD